MRLQPVVMNDFADPGSALSRGPWWLAERENDMPQRPFHGCDSVDIAIVGGGFTGLWTALTLKQRHPDLDVVLLEAGTCGWAASGRNGGSVNGYWSVWPKLCQLMGETRARTVADLGSEAQEAMRNFSRTAVQDIQWREDGFAVMATSRAQEGAIRSLLRNCRGVPDPYRPRPLQVEEIWEKTKNPRLTHGVLFPEGATVQPGYLVQALKSACLQAGVRLHESSTVTEVDLATTTVRTRNGSLSADHVVLATSAWMTSARVATKHTTNLSSHVAVTAPMPEVASQLDWPLGLMVRDARMFLHWVRMTADSRFVVGTGSGPFSARGAVVPAHSHHPPSTRRVMSVLKSFIPNAAHAQFIASWGGAIDLSSDSCPNFSTIPGTRVHYGTGYSGHGVNAAWIGGQILASLATGERDRWTGSPLCGRRRPRLPPEPLRYLGSDLIQRHTIALEDALDVGRRPSVRSRAITSIPKYLGIRIGTR